MLINCYYYAPHNHSMLTSHIQADLDIMAEIGTDIVSICVQESQITNWHSKRIENFIDLAHKTKLKVHAVPNRWAGLFAGWLDGFGRFTVQNSHLLVEDENQRPIIKGEMACCTSKPAVEEYVNSNLQSLLAIFDFDGIIWDEPHSYLCHCEFCKKAEIYTHEKKHQAFCSFLDNCSLYAKSLRKEMTTSVFVQPREELLLDALLESKNLDYIGSDGFLRSPKHQMHRKKCSIFEAYSKFAPKIKASGHKNFFLLEGQRHRDQDLQNYLDNIEKAFSLPIDHLMYYFSAHEMSHENEQIFNQATWEAVKKKKQITKILQGGI